MTNKKARRLTLIVDLRVFAPNEERIAGPLIIKRSEFL